MEKTRVVHCKRESYDVMIDRTTMFGNRHYICSTCTREQSIERFKVDFYERLECDLKFKAAVLELAGLILGCWCRPKEGFKGRLLCHGQIIVAYLEDCRPEDVE